MLPETSDLVGELSANVPRPVKYRTSTQAIRLFLLILLVFAVGFLCWLADRDLGDLNDLNAHGRTTLARVEDKHVTHGKSDSYSLDYDFHENGVWVYGSKFVDQDEYAAFSPGDTLPVTFLPSRPETYRLDEITPARIEAQQERWLWGELAVFFSFGLILVCVEAMFRQHLALLRDGSITVGVITRSADASKKEFSVTYKFTVDGKFSTATTSYSKKVACTQPFYEQIELGQALTILYLPANPSQSIPYRMLTDVTLSDRGKPAQ